MANQVSHMKLKVGKLKHKTVASPAKKVPIAKAAAYMSLKNKQKADPDYDKPGVPDTDDAY